MTRTRTTRKATPDVKATKQAEKELKKVKTDYEKQIKSAIKEGQTKIAAAEAAAYEKGYCDAVRAIKKIEATQKKAAKQLTAEAIQEIKAIKAKTPSPRRTSTTRKKSTKAPTTRRKIAEAPAAEIAQTFNDIETAIEPGEMIKNNSDRSRTNLDNISIDIDNSSTDGTYEEEKF